ncbi:unnamed protein product [Gadus morhua 'NCC']
MSIRHLSCPPEGQIKGLATAKHCIPQESKQELENPPIPQMQREHRRAVPQKEGNSGSHNPAILEGSLDASQREDPDAVVTGDLLPPNQWQGTLSLSPQPCSDELSSQSHIPLYRAFQKLLVHNFHLLLQTEATIYRNNPVFQRTMDVIFRMPRLAVRTSEEAKRDVLDAAACASTLVTPLDEEESVRLPLADHQPRPAAPRAPDFTSLANPRGGPGQWLEEEEEEEEEEEAAARALLEAPLRAWERRGGLHKPQAAENGLPEPEGRGRQCCCVEKGQIHSSPLVVIQS